MIDIQQRKIYILDTNVLVHDPNSLQHFDEHDVVLPIVVLEEMDKVKKGLDELARNVREASRQLDELSEACDDLSKGCELPGGGRLFFEMSHQKALDLLPESLARGGGDNRIIAVCLSVKQEHPDRQVILVSKDINLRVKARALGLKTEDYRSDRVISDLSILPSGKVRLDEEVWTAMAEGMEMLEHDRGNHFVVTWPEGMDMPFLKSFVVLPGEREIAMHCTQIDENRRVHLCDITSYRTERHAIWGIQARNLEQNMAMNLLMDAELDLVAMLGLAGSGKTLLALAAGLHQTLDMGLYEKILVTRATVPMGQDIGFLPGTEREKLEPWMGAITDNLSILLGDEAQNIGDVLGQHRIEIAALSFARGRTFTKTWLIVDEAQNLTPHQMKTIVTRMGEDSKIILLGNNAQIDTPYLTAHTNGLTLAVSAFAGWEHAGHIALKASERSRLAAKAVEVL
ncbi:PhoH-like ATPase [Mariprofundus ferrinatatus]|uniref:PhoH-like ATPase n=1 Tax=Mariprofundus ferrinatatus TaxID=1921087 RepID=A0A2K8L550_9PROT|nr:PhoH family protein [Mariprofundus ferrinatatus]ATX82407.1 PhoH-like ATPase [Mariprofundus ferrinatatus]